jgi:hypothetical protein
VNRRSRSRRKRKSNGVLSRQYDEEYELVNLRIFCEPALSKIPSENALIQGAKSVFSR